jgi:UDP-N-acetylglucosamine acyltransferase
VSRGARIHPTAIVDPAAALGADVEVGPFAVIGPDVVIGDQTRVGAHTVIEGPTRIGNRNRIFAFASVGTAPQDLKYADEPTVLEIGEGNTIREFATLNRGTAVGGGKTKVGSANLIMAYAHIAHDCVIGDSVVMANGATLGGHVIVQDHAIVGGLVAIHQHVRVGESAILGGGAMVTLDVPPFCMAVGDRARLHGLNLVGLRRRGFGAETIRRIRGAYRVLFQSALPLSDAVARLREEAGISPEVGRMVAFVAGSQRGICR